jgi:hypothetical protein
MAYEARRLFLCGYFLDMFFNPENGGRMFLQDVGGLLPDYTALFLKMI